MNLRFKNWLWSFDDELFSEVVGKKFFFGRYSSEESKYIPIVTISLILFLLPNFSFIIAYMTVSYIPSLYVFFNWNFTHGLVAMGIIATFILKKQYLQTLAKLFSSGNIKKEYLSKTTGKISPRGIRVGIILSFSFIVIRNWFFVSPLEVQQTRAGIVTNPLSTGFFGYIGACWMSLTGAVLTAILIMDFLSLVYLSILRPWKESKELKIIFLHEDSCGGFKPLGNFALALSSTYFFFITLLTLRLYVDFIVAGWTEITFLQEIERRPILTLGIMVILITVWLLGIAIFFLSQYTVHRRMKQQKEDSLEKYTQPLRNLQIESPTLNTEEMLLRLQLIEGRKVINQVREWPYDNSVLKRLLIAAFSPLFIQGWVTVIFSLLS